MSSNRRCVVVGCAQYGRIGRAVCPQTAVLWGVVGCVLCLFNVRLVSPQRCSPSRNGRFARPSAHSAYASTRSGWRPAQIGSFSKPPRRWRRRNKPRLATSGVRRVAPPCLRGVARLVPARRASAPGAFIRAKRRETALPADGRLSCLAGSARRLRRTASSRLAQLVSRPRARASRRVRRRFFRFVCGGAERATLLVGRFVLKPPLGGVGFV